MPFFFKFYIMKHYSIIVLYILLLSLYSCSSASMEYRSAVTKVRTEKDLAGGEEWALKALIIDSLNAQVPYFMATEIYKKQQRWNDCLLYTSPSPRD